MADIDYTDQLLDELKIFRFRLTTSMVRRGQRATGKTIASMREASPTPGTAQLFAPFYLNALETGVAPSKLRPFPKPSLDFIRSLRAWAAAKGIAVSPYALANKIIRHGTKLFRNGGGAPTITDVINDEALGAMRARIGTAAKQNVFSQLRREFPDPTK